MTAFLALALALLAAHPDSRSSSRVTVSGARVEVDLLCQAQSLVEALPIDANGDGLLSAEEMVAARALVQAYVAERYRVYSGPPDTNDPMAGAGAGTFERLELTRPMDESADWVVARFVLESEGFLERLWIQVTLFQEQNPLHRDECTLLWNDLPRARFRFGEQGALWSIDPDDLPGPRALGGWVREGLLHILTGPDHLAFLCALLLAAANLRSLVLVVTAFTVAHSLTLAAAALDWVAPPGLLVELAIALSIAYVAILNLIAKAPVARWPEAFVFGLVHGLGFAGFLGDLLVFETSVLVPLFGFNVGVELGQLAVVALAAGLCSVLPGRRRQVGGDRTWLAPRWLRKAGSVVLAGAGLFWFAQRAGFV